MSRKSTLDKELLLAEPVHFKDLRDILLVSQEDLLGDPQLDDATVVLRATSLLNDILEFTITARFRCEPSKSALAAVFAGDGPLATFSDKITLATAFGIIRGDARNDFKVLRKIRNEFAHSPRRISFASDKRWQSLKMRDRRWPQIKAIERRRFLESVSSLVLHCVIACGSLVVEEHLLWKHGKEGERLTHRLFEWIQSDGDGKPPF